MIRARRSGCSHSPIRAGSQAFVLAKFWLRKLDATNEAFEKDAKSKPPRRRRRTDEKKGISLD